MVIVLFSSCYFSWLFAISISSFAHNIESRVRLPQLGFLRSRLLRRNQLES